MWRNSGLTTEQGMRATSRHRISFDGALSSDFWTVHCLIGHFNVADAYTCLLAMICWQLVSSLGWRVDETEELNGDATHHMRSLAHIEAGTGVDRV